MSTKDQTRDESASLLEAVDRLEKEASNLRNDISLLQAELNSIQPKLYDKANSPSHRSSVENYSIKLNHKFYEFTGVSIKNLTDNLMKVCFYVKHDDWAPEVRLYWLKLQISECPKVVAYDFPFMVDMKEIEQSHPIVSNDDLFAFVNYIRRCIESYFDRRQQVHELDKSLNPAYAKVFMNMHYTLIQIKLLPRKDNPEKMFSIWYRDDATLPHKCVVRIPDGGHEELIKNLTMGLTVLNTKPLPEAFVEGTQNYLNLESSSEECSSGSDEDDAVDLESWFLPSQTNVRKRPRNKSRTKRGRRGVAIGRDTSKDDVDVSDSSAPRQPPTKRLKKPNNTEGNDIGVDDSTPLRRKGRTSKRDINMKGAVASPKDSTRKRPGTPWKYDVVNWRKSASPSPRRSGRTSKSVHSKDERNGNAVENASVGSRNTKEKVAVRNTPKKSVYFNVSESSEQNVDKSRVSELQQKAGTSRSSSGSVHNTRQSSMTNFLKPVGNKANINIPKTPKPRETHVEPVVYENEFESDDQASLHSAETVRREPRR